MMPITGNQRLGAESPAGRFLRVKFWQFVIERCTSITAGNYLMTFRTEVLDAVDSIIDRESITENHSKLPVTIYAVRRC